MREAKDRVTLNRASVARTLTAPRSSVVDVFEGGEGQGGFSSTFLPGAGGARGALDMVHMRVVLAVSREAARHCVRERTSLVEGVRLAVV